MKLSELDTKSFLGAQGATNNSYVLINYEDSNTSKPITYKASIEELGKAIANSLHLYKETTAGVVTTRVNNNSYVDNTPKYLITDAEQSILNDAVTWTAMDTVSYISRSDLTQALSNYASATELASYFVDIHDLENYATLNDLENYASINALNAAISAMPSMPEPSTVLPQNTYLLMPYSGSLLLADESGHTEAEPLIGDLIHEGYTFNNQIYHLVVTDGDNLYRLTESMAIPIGSDE